LTDVADPVDVEAAGGDVGGDQDVEAALLERVDGPLALRLNHVAVDGGGREPSRLELVGELLRRLLGADEDDHRLERLDLEHPRQRVDLVAAGDLDVTLPGVRRRHGAGLDQDLHRVVQVLLGQPADLRRHRGGEQRHLLAVGGVGQDALDVLGEAHAQHLVGLVQHQVGEVAQLQRSPCPGGR
jgi:hypothetical protein